MTVDELEKIMNEEYDCEPTKKNEILAGLNIMVKYLPETGIICAQHDEVWSASIEDLLDAGLTEDDAIQLRKLGWRIDCDTMSHFV